MKKEHIETFISEFVDYLGKTHKFVLAAISQELPNKVEDLDIDAQKECGSDSGDSVTFEVNCYVEDYGTIDSGFTILTKTLKIGYSICNPSDTFNEEIGIKKAIARARQSVPVIYATSNGVINTPMVKALLQQEADYLKDNPENYIPGYAETKARFEKHVNKMKDFGNFSDFELKVYNELTTKGITCLDRVLNFYKWETRRK